MDTKPILFKDLHIRAKYHIFSFMNFQEVKRFLYLSKQMFNETFFYFQNYQYKL